MGLVFLILLITPGAIQPFTGLPNLIKRTPTMPCLYFLYFWPRRMRASSSRDNRPLTAPPLRHPKTKDKTLNIRENGITHINQQRIASSTLPLIKLRQKLSLSLLAMTLIRFNSSFFSSVHNVYKTRSTGAHSSSLS